MALETGNLTPSIATPLSELSNSVRVGAGIVDDMHALAVDGNRAVLPALKSVLASKTVLSIAIWQQLVHAGFDGAPAIFVPPEINEALI